MGIVSPDVLASAQGVVASNLREGSLDNKKRLIGLGSGITVLAAMLAFPASGLAGTKVTENWRYVPADPYSGRPALECRTTVVKKFNFFGSKSRSSEDCRPARRRPYNPGYQQRQQYDPGYQPDDQPGYDPNQ
jgi:hypothetical protein